MLFPVLNFKLNDSASFQTMRITELQSVIAELTRKLNAANDNKIIEEEEEDFEENDEDEDARSGFTSDIENQGKRASLEFCVVISC